MDVTDPETIDANYPWRFKINRSQEDAGLYDDKLTEMVRRQLKALLSVVVLTADGSEVAVTGFKFQNDLEREPFAIFGDQGS